MTTTTRIIAEIGCNHAGDIDLAERMVAVAASFCQADAVKFQKRHPRTLLSEEQFNTPHPNPENSYGDTYGAHREYLEFDVDQHRQIQEKCSQEGVTYSTSVWDIPSASDIVSLNPEFIKIPSACNTNLELLDYVCSHFPGYIHVSLGMTSRREEEELVRFLDSRGRLSTTVLYACTSGYPVDFGDLCLLEITRLNEEYGEQVSAIGFSGHHLGIAADIAAMTLGARWIERHFTLDRTMRGTDHAASLEPDGMRRLTRDIKAVSEALTYKSQEVLEVEAPQRDKLKWTSPQ